MSPTFRSTISTSRFFLAPLALLALASTSAAQASQTIQASDPVLEELGISAYTLQDLHLPARPGTA
ncbi:MAG: hypothetical protein QF615_10705, partial [Planctomycetota bacterium]|nr:hypothetical protein [Planctomycetota bacterium]